MRLGCGELPRELLERRDEVCGYGDRGRIGRRTADRGEQRAGEGARFERASESARPVPVH
jgi:hypothetical protein